MSARLLFGARALSRVAQSGLLRAAPKVPKITMARNMAGKADQSLGQFLTEEISVERKNLQSLPAVGSDFKVEQEGADLKFVKEADGEKVTIQLNINHTVDSAEPDDGTEEAPEMRSRPNFEVDITKAGKTLSFSCSYIPDMETGQEGAQTDLFAIDEVTIFDGEWNETKYAVAGDILDGTLYDHFMSILEERGVTAEFADQMSAYCSAYEHSQYIRLLENLQNFVK